LRDALRKHREEITTEAAQFALGVENIGMKMFTVFREQVEAGSKMIVRLVKGVNRSQEPQPMLDATGRVQYTDKTVVESMPRGEGEKKEVIFFQPRQEAYRNGVISGEALDKEYEFVGLKPVDPYSLCKVNTDDPAFADTCPNATHWKDANDKWCYIAFNRWGGGKRYVGVNRNDNGWRGSWQFAGVRE
jgi:hypothetical protein